MPNNEKVNAALDLYLTDKYTGVQISQMLGVGEGTISKWAIKGDWEFKRDEVVKLQSDIEADIRYLIRRNLKILRARGERDDLLLSEGSIEEVADLEVTTGKDTDALSKLFSQIRREELRLKDRIEVLTDFLRFCETKDLSFAKLLIAFTDAYRDQLFNKQRG